MSNEKTVRGYIDCPTCGTVGGMRITDDKNGHPFGFCTATCRQQLRVGPDAERVALFLKQHPLKDKPEARGAQPQPNGGPWPWRDMPAATPAATPAAPAPAPAPAARKRSSLADAVAFLGGGA